jgi:hypothetical protein
MSNSRHGLKNLYPQSQEFGVVDCRATQVDGLAVATSFRKMPHDLFHGPNETKQQTPFAEKLGGAPRMVGVSDRGVTASRLSLAARMWLPSPRLRAAAPKSRLRQKPNRCQSSGRVLFY